MNEVIEITKGHLAVIILLAFASGMIGVGMLWFASVASRVKRALGEEIDDN